MIVWLSLGALLGGLFIGFARRLAWRNQVRFFAACLFLGAVAYPSFAAFQGEAHWIALESAGAALFILLAWIGLRHPLVLALGWLVHLAWDVGLHLAIEQPVVGAWLPQLCIPFDALVAAYLAYATLNADSRDALAAPDRASP